MVGSYCSCGKDTDFHLSALAWVPALYLIMSNVLSPSAQAQKISNSNSFRPKSQKKQGNPVRMT